MAARTAPLGYLLHLADNALVLGQRNAEWCAHGPVLEEDIAMANISLDLIGQARMLYQHAAAVQGQGATEDSLAYFRDEQDFRNFTLLELPHHGPLAGSATADRDYATTIVRNFLYSAFALRQWNALQSSADAQLAAIAGRALKEVKYHLRHARDWLVRLGDGTDESHARVQAALEHLMPYTEEFWTVSADEAAAIADGTAADPLAFRAEWDSEVDDALAEATLRRPSGKGHLPRGKQGQHSEHLSYLLGEMQSLARQHPGGDVVNAVQRAWDLLEQVPDPEIPVVSIRELGILREINERDGGVEIVITPTYSGCPAMGQIEDDVRSAMAAAGLRAQVVTRLAPAWTTDWMTETAKQKLRAYGIAPPHTTQRAENVLRFQQPRTAAAVACPHCGSANTTETSHFGSTACKSLYKCLDCLEPFDYFKTY